MDKIIITPIQELNNYNFNQDGDYYGENDLEEFCLMFSIKYGILIKRQDFESYAYFFSLPITINSFDSFPAQKGFYYTIKRNGWRGGHAYFDGYKWTKVLDSDESWVYPQVDISDNFSRSFIISSGFSHENLQEIIAKLLK